MSTLLKLPFLAASVVLVMAPPACSEPPAAASKPARIDLYGGALPEGALARLGSINLRHDAEARYVTFLPDGKMLASYGEDRFVRFWDAATGRELHRIAVLTIDYTSSCAFSPDGKLFAAGTGDNFLYLWDVATGRELPKTGIHSLSFVTFSPDSRLLVTAGGGMLHVYEATTGKQLYQVGGQHPGRPWATFSPDGKFLATREGEGTSVRATATGKELFRLKQQYHATFSPDGKLLATAGPDAAVSLWEAATGKEVRRLTGHRPAVTSVAFSPDGKFLIVDAAHGGAEVRIHLWEAATGKERHQFRNAAHPAFSPDSKVLALRCNGLHLWDLAADRELHTLKESAGFSAAAFSPDGKTLATAEGGFGVRLWDVAAGKEVLTRPAAGGLAAVFSPDGKVLATAGRSVQLWDAATGKELLRLVAGSRLGALAWSADGRTLAAAGTGKVYLWDLAFPAGGPPQASNWREADAHQGKPFALAFSPDGKLLASAGEDQALVLWDAAAGKPVRRVSGPMGHEPSVAFSADGKDVLTASTSALAFFRGAATGKGALTYQNPLAIWAGLPADGRVMAWDDNGTVSLLDVATGAQLAQFERPRGTMPVRFSPDGRVLACVDPSGIVRLCEIASGREVFHFSIPPIHCRIQALSPDGRTLATAGLYGDVLVWDLVPEGWDAARGPRDPGPAELARLWRDLARDDAAAAYRAAWALVAARQKSAPFLKDLLRPAAESQGERGIRKLIADLDADTFAVRESASKELVQLGPAAAPLLRQALEGTPSPEVRRRAEAILEELKALENRARPGGLVGEPLRAVRAIQVLERIGTADAREVLWALAKGAPGARPTQEAQAALERLARRPPASP